MPPKPKLTPQTQGVAGEKPPPSPAASTSAETGAGKRVSLGKRRRSPLSEATASCSSKTNDALSSWSVAQQKQELPYVISKSGLRLPRYTAEEAHKRRADYEAARGYPNRYPLIPPFEEQSLPAPEPDTSKPLDPTGEEERTDHFIDEILIDKPWLLVPFPGPHASACDSLFWCEDCYQELRAHAAAERKLDYWRAKAVAEKGSWVRGRSWWR